MEAVPLSIEKIRSYLVLTIPVKASYKPIKEIIFLTGYKAHCQRNEFQYLVVIAKHRGSNVYFPPHRQKQTVR
jgi:hypothetical protein